MAAGGHPTDRGRDTDHDAGDDQKIPMAQATTTSV